MNKKKIFYLLSLLCFLSLGNAWGMEKKGSQNPEIPELEACDKITDEGLKHIANKLTNLKSLNLERCYEITDEGIRHIANLRQLQSLDLFPRPFGP